MTAQLLQIELTNLLQEAKRKNSDLRHATENSLLDLKSLGTNVDISGELSSKSGFISPFLIACGTRNTKFSTIGIVCLQRLIVSKALPKSRLKEVLEAFGEAAHLGVDVQLKILQSLPPLLENYADNLQGELLGESLLICAILQSSKMGVVNNTAAATLSQIVISIFDKVAAEDERAMEVPTTGEAASKDGLVPVKPAALDAYNVFYDICLLTIGQRPKFLRFNSLPQAFALELIESVLTNHHDIFLAHPEQAHILRTQVAPLIMRSLSERLNFPTTVRITRVLYILIRRHLSILPAECEVSLGLLTQMLEPDYVQPWKRALCMEVFRGICAEPALIRKIFSEYDAKEDKKPLVRELMSAMTRLATEKPNVIGLGTYSSTSLDQQYVKDSSDANLEAGGVAGIISGAVGFEVNVIGLGAWSLIRVPCIDQLDKSEPPSMPESYIYYLTLICLNNFSEGLAKFVLPLSFSNEPQKRRPRVMLGASGTTGSDSETAFVRPSTPDGGQTASSAKTLRIKRKSLMRGLRVPVNPINLETHSQYAEIVLSKRLVESCWPAILAAFSTFLYSTLDRDLYHGLVRGIQKFTHVAGVFRLKTPRDAFLTTFGKAAVPSNLLSASLHFASPMASSVPNTDNMFAGAKGLLSAEYFTPGSSGTTNNAIEYQTSPSLNIRNLLCLRALLNLGIVLGSTLQEGWSIVMETLQHADFVIYMSNRKGQRIPDQNSRTESQRTNDSATLGLTISSELQTVEIAVGKMLEATKDFPDEAFVAILVACCKLLGADEDHLSAEIPDDNLSPHIVTTVMSTTSHKRGLSLASVSTSSQVIGDHAFALAKLNELAQINVDRIIGPNPETSGWNLLFHYLISLCGARDMGSNIRLKAMQVLNDVLISAAKSVNPEHTDNFAEAQTRILVALNKGINYGHKSNAIDASTKSTELEIHRAVLEALHSILEHTGQSLVAGWDIAFNIITSIFDSSMICRREFNTPTGPEVAIQDSVGKSNKSISLIRSSFSSLELICTDFLASIPTSCVLVLVDALFAFCTQKDDLNISLTTVTFFWNLSDFLQSENDSGSMTGGDTKTSREELTVQVENESDLLALVQRKGVDSRSALWMLLLLRLAGVSKDSRPEVRNGSIQTLFRIFDTYGKQLGPDRWSSCLKIVVFKMMSVDPNDLAVYSNSGVEERKQWDDTIKLVLGGIGTLYSNYFKIFTHQQDFCMTWSVFVRYLETLLSWKSFEVSATVFGVLSRVLDQIERPDDLPTGSQDETWVLWSSLGIRFIEGSVCTSSIRMGTGIQEALTSYVLSFKSLYRLLSKAMSAERVQKALEILKECILYPDAPSYYNDVENLTPLQTSVLDCVKNIRSDTAGVPPLLLREVSEFATVAYTTALGVRSNSNNRLPTCIALSTQCMGLLERVAVNHINDSEIYTSLAMSRALEALEIPIGLKYNFNLDKTSNLTKRPNQWIFATKSVLTIVKEALPAMAKLGLSDRVRTHVWKKIIKIIASIIRTSNNHRIDERTLRADEMHDIKAFGEMKDLLMANLDQWDVPDEIISEYIKSIFWSSMLYDTPRVDPEKWLKLGKHGNTSELVLERRFKMSYVCIEELFSLVSMRRDSVAFSNITAITAPWLVYRVGMVLRSYVLDQPLRGRMPQPTRQRKEMLDVLSRILRLNLGKESIYIDLPFDPPSSKGYLFQLFPLFTKCIVAAHEDHELLALLSLAFKALGNSLEIR